MKSWWGGPPCPPNSGGHRPPYKNCAGTGWKACATRRNFPGQSFSQPLMTTKNLAPLVPVDRATNHQPQGRQSAVDKKWGQNPVKETVAMLAKPAGGGEGENFPSGNRTALPPNKKTPIPLNQGIEDCTRLAWSSSRRPARIARACPSILQAGFLALGSIYSRRLPRACINPSGLQPVSSPITAAGPRRFFTVFPLPLWDL
jgi:hypothetical protein